MTVSATPKTKAGAKTKSSPKKVAAKSGLKKDATGTSAAAAGKSSGSQDKSASSGNNSKSLDSEKSQESDEAKKNSKDTDDNAKKEKDEQNVQAEADLLKAQEKQKRPETPKDNISSDYEIHGPQGQNAHYGVGLLNERKRPHPGPGFHICQLYLVGECNNYSAFPDQFRNGDPLGIWPNGGLCAECWQRRKHFSERNIPVDCGNQGSPKRKKYDGHLHDIMPIVPDFTSQEVKTLLFYGDSYTPRMSKGARFFRDIDLPELSQIKYTSQLYRDIDTVTSSNEWKLFEIDQSDSEESKRNPVSTESDANKLNGPNPNHLISIHDSQPLVCSSQELVNTMYDLYCRDCVGKVAPSLLSLVTNLDPDVVVLSGGTLDLTEGCEAKDILCALKIMGEEAIKVPRSNPDFPPRKVIYWGIPISPVIDAYPSMCKRRELVLDRLRYYCQDHADFRLIEADPVSGDAGASSQYPLTTNEYQAGVRKILNSVLTPGQSKCQDSSQAEVTN